MASNYSPSSNDTESLRQTQRKNFVTDTSTTSVWGCLAGNKNNARGSWRFYVSGHGYWPGRVALDFHMHSVHHPDQTISIHALRCSKSISRYTQQLDMAQCHLLLTNVQQWDRLLKKELSTQQCLFTVRGWGFMRSSLLQSELFLR